ncbi:MAG: type II toxin-antitoxin system RelE/ParE family toxin [Clostridiales bacterium]|jgi:plasmid stabilization system protein ParE|nr:type II toxin-antitoxin system RelE/ParE family toxin [Clostridiales bacterium]
MSASQKRYKVNVSEKAKLMMRRHIRFLTNVSPTAAKKLQRKLDAGIKSLRLMPYRCPVCYAYETEDVYRRLIVDRRYQIIFSVYEESSTVEIQQILDSRQNNRI